MQSIDNASILVSGNAMAFVWLATVFTETQDQAKDLAKEVILWFKKFMEIPPQDEDLPKRS